MIKGMKMNLPYRGSCPTFRRVVEIFLLAGWDDFLKVFQLSFWWSSSLENED